MLNNSNTLERICRINTSNFKFETNTTASIIVCHSISKGPHHKDSLSHLRVICRKVSVLIIIKTLSRISHFYKYTPTTITHDYLHHLIRIQSITMYNGVLHRLNSSHRNSRMIVSNII